MDIDDSSSDTSSSSGSQSDMEDASMYDDIYWAQDEEVRHASVRVPKGTSPFLNNDRALHNFIAILTHIVDTGVLPSGYGVKEDEWEDGIYSDLAWIPIGKWGERTKEVVLPGDVWLPRAQLWAQALDIMT